MRIEVAGGIATGKTSFANYLAEHGHFALVKESYRGVPFWNRFYRDPRHYALEKNLSFLLAHADLIPDCSSSRNVTVCDFAMFQDMAYASLAPQEDLPLLEKVYERLVARMKEPALIVHLECSVESQVSRIQLRRREVEQSISADYLSNLNRHITIQLKHIQTTLGVPVIKIDTESLDFRRKNPACDDCCSEVTASLAEPSVRDNVSPHDRERLVRRP
jgi:deoxyadenosine/deoxycytidine kinase